MGPDFAVAEGRTRLSHWISPEAVSVCDYHGCSKTTYYG